MSVIAVESGTIENYVPSDEVMFLRVYLRKSFTPSSGEALIASRIGSQNFYQEIPCTVVDGVITYEAFEIDSTTDAMSNPNDAFYTFVLYALGGVKKGIVYKTIKVPHTDATTTLGELAAYNAVDAVGVSDLYYTRDESDTRYAPEDEGVTNGDSHDHNGGDGAQIAHANLSGIGSNTHAQIDTHLANMANPHNVTKAQVGLGSADNTSDADKPISTAAQAALDAIVAATLASLALKANDAQVVHNSGNEVVAGIKTFASSPIVPTPTTDMQAATKKYIDDIAIAGGVVISVNGQIGIVLLDAGDINPVTNRNYVTDAQAVVIGNTSGVNTGDQNLQSVLSDAAYNQATWDNDATHAPTKNAVRDIVEAVLAIIAAQINAAQIADGSVSNAEFQRLNGVTGDIQGQIDGKQATLISGTNIKTVNGDNLLGAGDIVVEGGGGSPGQTLALAQGNFLM